MEKFESVLGSKPDPDEASVASYNVACCYSKLDQVFLSVVDIYSVVSHIVLCFGMEKYYLYTFSFNFKHSKSKSPSLLKSRGSLRVST